MEAEEVETSGTEERRMKQATAQKISDAFHAWQDAETIALYEVSISLGTDDSLGRLAEAIQEQFIVKADGQHIGLRMSFVVSTRHSNLNSCENALTEALQGIAYGENRWIDYIEKVRVKADKPEDECIAVEVLEIGEKRNIWL